MLRYAPLKIHDPVCGAELAAAQPLLSATYRGLDFHFCSTQCLERFQDTPEFYAGPHHAIDMSPIAKQRRLHIEEVDSEVLELACKRIAGMLGVSAVTLDDGDLLVDYDLRKVSLLQIETAATGAGIHFKEGLHGLLRDNWKFAEHNELANIAAANEPGRNRLPPGN